jgi:hypothetical protein
LWSADRQTIAARLWMLRLTSASRDETMSTNLNPRRSVVRRPHTLRSNEPWTGALRDAVVSGAVAAAATALYASRAGARDSGSAIAPINATSHIAWGERATRVEKVDGKHTVPGLLLHFGACIMWATVYERYFGRATERGNVGAALVGGGAVASAAYVTDYHVVPKRLTPGWESRVSGRSLAMIYGVLACALPLRGLLRRRR